MRILNSKTMVVVALLLFGASTASAIGIRHEVRGGTLSSYGASDTLVIDVFLDAADVTNLQTVAVTVVADETIFSYDGAASQALPVIYPAPAPAYGTNGNQPGYIFYTAGMPATALYPTSDPYAEFNGNQLPGELPINVVLLGSGLNGVKTGADNTWIASLVFHVDAEFASSDIFLAIDGQTYGTQVATRDGTNPVVDISGSVALSDAITLTGHAVPEPTTALLIGFGLMGLTLAGRRKA